MLPRCVRRWLACVWVVAAGAAGAPAVAQTTQQASSQDQLINWYYAAVFGTGVYRSGDRTVSVLQIPFSHDLQVRWHDELGIKLTVPVSFGFYDFRFDQLVNGAVPHTVSTASVFPGVELDVPVTDKWIVKPYLSVGRAWEISGTQEATIYGTGLKSRYTVPIGKDSDISLGNQLTLSGYRPDGQANQPLSVFVAGLNLEVPTGVMVLDREARAGFHLIYYHYFKRLLFPHIDNTQNSVLEEGEIGFSLATRVPISFELFDLDRVGIAFRFGGGIQAVRLFFSLPY
jgi:hypothetical protein